MTATLLADALETLHRQMNRAWQDGAAADLTYSEFEYLRALQRIGGPHVPLMNDSTQEATDPGDHGLHLQCLATAVGVSKASASVAVARLEERGLIMRTPCFRDARAQHLSLTVPGQEALTIASQRYHDLAAALLRSLPGLETTALFRAAKALPPL